MGSAMHLHAAFNDRLADWTELQIKHKEAAVATAAQSFAIDLAKLGDTRIIRELTIAIGDNGNEWGAGAYFQLHKKATAPAGNDLIPGTSTTLIGEGYFNNSTILLFENLSSITTNVWIYLDHAAGSVKDVYVGLKTKYKTA